MTDDGWYVAGFPDPFAVATVGGEQTHTTSVIKKTLNPYWNEMFDLYEKYLGKESLKSMHMHYSGIEYTEKGERKHLPLQKSDAKWKDFLKVLKKRNIEGTVVCESPLLEEDTLLLKKEFDKLK